MKIKLLETRLGEIDALAAAGELPEASLTQEGLSIGPIRSSENEAADALVRRLYAMLSAARIRAYSAAAGRERRKFSGCQSQLGCAGFRGWACTPARRRQYDLAWSGVAVRLG